MDEHSERGQTWTRQDKERFLDRIGGYELEAGELSEEEIRSLLEKEREPGIGKRLGTHLDGLGLRGFYDGRDRAGETREKEEPEPRVSRSEPEKIPPAAPERAPARDRYRDDGRGR